MPGWYYSKHIAKMNGLSFNKNILILGKYIDSDVLPGPFKVANRLFNYMNKLNNNTIFVEYFYKSKTKKSNFIQRLFGQEIIHSSPIVIKMGVFRLFYFLIKRQPDIIQIASAESFIITVFLYKFLIKGKIITIKHGIIKQEYLENSNYDNIRKALLYESMEMYFCDAICFMSVNQMEIAKKHYKILEKTFFIVSNGIDEVFFRNSDTFKTEKVIKIIFYNGFDLMIDRGVAFLIETINKFNRRNEIQLFVIGQINPNLINSADFQLVSVPVMPKEKLLSFLVDKHIILKSNRTDSFPIFVCECMAFGIIPIISEKIGMDRYIENYKNGFLYNSSNQFELLNILEFIFDNKNLLQPISQEARKIYHKLNWNRIVQEYIDIYDSMV